MASLRVLTRIITQRRLESRSAIITFSKKLHLWTSDNTVKSPIKDIEIPNRTVHEHIWENLDKWADKTAIVCGVTNRSYTYHQLYKYSLNIAAKLRSYFNIRDDDVICIMIPNGPDYALATLGILQAGAIVTTINPIYTFHEVHRQLLLSNPKVIIGVPDTIKVIKEALKLANMDIPIMTCEYIGEDLPAGTVSFEEFALDNNVDHTVLKEVNRNINDVAFLPYSSGTTGLPKGVELTHRNIVANCAQQDVAYFKIYNDTTSSNQDSTLGILPFYHLYGLSVVMLHKLSVGLKVVTLPKFQSTTFLNALDEHKISLLYAAPPIILFLATYPQIKSQHLKSIKTITCGAAPVPNNDIMEILNRVKHKMNFLQLYGLTETSPLATAMLPGSDAYTTAGFAVPNTELRIVDSNLRSLGPNENGELLIRGPQIMKGYRNNPEATKAAITEDGWFKSGDLARIGEDGAVTIADRIKELIKVKSYQVPPAELENVLKEHPDILDAAVIGVPDTKYGEVPKAFIVVKDGRNVETQEVCNFVADRVAEYKRIKEVMILESLPKNPSGKILKRVLKDKFGSISE